MSLTLVSYRFFCEAPLKRQEKTQGKIAVAAAAAPSILALVLSLPCQRVCGVVDAGKCVEVEVRIALCRRDTAVAEQFLHGAQIRPAFKEMRSEGVAQVMG